MVIALYGSRGVEKTVKIWKNNAGLSPIKNLEKESQEDIPDIYKNINK